MKAETPVGTRKIPGLLVATGSLVLLAGLLAGPTPGDEPAEALRRIDEFRTRYILTNGIDFIGILILTVGLLGLARMLADEQRASYVGMLAWAGVLSGGVMLVAVLTFESTVIPSNAERYVAATADGQAIQLAIGEAMLELDAAVFGVALMLYMFGVAGIFYMLLPGTWPRLNRMFLLAGLLLASIASLTGMFFLFEPVEALGRLEPVFSLAALVWLVALGVLLSRSGSRRLQ
jgi:hypothetical protein